MTCPPKKRLFRVGRSLDDDIARQHADFAAFIHVEGDLAEVHVVELLVERDRVSADGGNVAPLCLPGIEIRGRENDLVAGAPAGSVQDLDRGGAGVRCAGQLRPGICPVTVKIQGSAHEHDPAVTAVISTQSAEVFVFDVVGEGNGRLRVWGLASVPISNSPCTMIHSVVSSRSLSSAKLSLPLIVKPCSGGGLTSRTTFMSLSMVTTASLPGTFLSGQVAASDQRFPLAVGELVVAP